MFRQNLAPVGKKLRVVMLTRKMGLQARPDIDVHAIGVLARYARSALRTRGISRLRRGLCGACQKKQQRGAQDEMEDPQFGNFIIRVHIDRSAA